MSQHSNNKDDRCYPILLQKSEWERLKRQAGPLQLEDDVEDSRKEYFEALNEQSRKWIKNWPDSSEGVKAKLEEDRKNRQKDNKAFIENYKKNMQKTDNSQELLKKGKQVIFDRSCYGRQLISAIIESRTIDDRELQMRVKKEIEDKEAECERNKKHVANPLDFDETAAIALRKQATIDCAQFNKELEREKKDEEAKLKAREDECDIIDDEMIKQFKEAKAKIKAETKRKEKQEIEEYAAVNKEIKGHRKIREAYEEALVKAHKKEQDTMRCKIDAVIKQAIEESRSGERAVKIYKEIEEIQNAQQKKYDDFVGKSIEEFDERKSNQDAKDKEKEENKRAEQRRLAEENKIAARNQQLQLRVSAPVNKCLCDVQTLLVKPDREKRRLRALKNLDKSTTDEERALDKGGRKGKCPCLERECKKDRLSFLRPRRTFLEALQARAELPSAYSGSKGADLYFAQQASQAIDMCNHKYFPKKVVDRGSAYSGSKGADLYFAQQASQAIDMCNHKYFPKKVVDDYLKTNCLNLSDLSIPNY